jgi:ATP-dependent Clp protease ATP-binding subunit ClpC
MAQQYDDRWFTDRSRKVMKLANEEAHRLHHSPLDLAHLFLALIREGNGVAANVLKALDVDLPTARLGIERLVPAEAQNEPSVLPLSQELSAAINVSLKEAAALKHRYVGTEHLLLALCTFPGTPHAQVLATKQITLEQIRAVVFDLLGHSIDAATEHEPAVEAERAPTLEILLDPGTATSQEISELFFQMSKLYRLAGGRGIQFTMTDAREPIFAEGVR